MPPPLTVELNRYAQIEILRAEIARAEEELKETEKQIREILTEDERQKFLRTVHAMYQTMRWPEPAGDLNKLNDARNLLSDALEALRAALAKLEAEKGGKPAPAPSSTVAASPASLSSGARKRFDSFETFRANQGDGKK